MTAGPGTFTELEAIRDDSQRLSAATAYIVQREEAIERARDLRDEAIVALLAAGRPVAEVAEIAGMSVAHVRQVQRWKS
jgi:predicted transposase YdaD